MGVLFQFNPGNNAFTVKVNFDGAAKGQNPYGSLMQAMDGNLYGMTTGGGLNEYGVLFQFNPQNSSFAKILDFDMVTNGGNPDGSLIQAKGWKALWIDFCGWSNIARVFCFNLILLPPPFLISLILMIHPNGSSLMAH